MICTLSFSDSAKDATPGSIHIKQAFFQLFSRCIVICFFLSISIVSFSQMDDDISTAEMYAKKFKEDGVLCQSSYRYFTFDKGKNALNDKVVMIEENAEYEFLSLKKFSSIMYPEYYNKFVQLKTFKRAIKYGSKFITSDRGGIDRSVTDDGVFFDDSRVQFYPLRFSRGSLLNIKWRLSPSPGQEHFVLNNLFQQAKQGL